MPRKGVDLAIGAKFGQWEVVGPVVRTAAPSPSNPTGYKYNIPVRCSCGTEALRGKSNLLRGATKGCGCELRARFVAEMKRRRENPQVPTVSQSPPRLTRRQMVEEARKARRLADIAEKLKAKGFVVVER